MSDIPDEAVEAAWQRLNEDSRGAPHKAVVYSALEAALPNLYGTLRLTHPTTTKILEDIDTINALSDRIKVLEERHKRLLHFAHQVAGGEIEASGCRVAARAAVQQDAAFGLGPVAPSWHCGRHGLPLGECGVCHGPCDGGMVCVVCTNEGSE